MTLGEPLTRNPNPRQETWALLEQIEEASPTPAPAAMLFEALTKASPFQRLVLLVITQSSSDLKALQVWQSLQPMISSPGSVVVMQMDGLQDAIHPSGNALLKARIIKEAAASLKTSYSDNRLPTDLPSVTALAMGIGPKTALAWLNMEACEGVDPAGVAVDTHVQRISKALGWVPADTSSPQSCRQALEGWL